MGDNNSSQGGDLPNLPTSSATPGSSGDNPSTPTPTSSGSASPSSSESNDLPTTSGDSASSSSTSADASVITDAPSLSSDTPFSLPSGLPTLSGHYSYPPPTVPPIGNAPFMQASVLPQNFVFIVVGACLALIAVIIIAWRFITAWSINRNFKRDNTVAAYTPLTDSKKKPMKAEPSHDLSDLSAKLPSSFNSVPNLFFSPTAEVARQSMVRPGSQHMPAGHYRDASR